MKLSASDAALLSPAERELVETKGPWHVKDLVRAIERTRRLRDKSRDLLQRQTIAQRRTGKGAMSKDANARSGAKARVFERALENFQKQLAVLDTDSTSAMKLLQGGDAATPGSTSSESVGPAAKAAKKTAAKKTAVKKAAVKKAAVKKAAVKKAAVKKVTANDAVAEAAASPSAAPRKKAAKKVAAKAAKPAAAKRAVGPRKTVSDKARLSVERTIGGPSSAQTVSAASRATRASKSRRGG